MKRKLVVFLLLFFPLLTCAQIGGEDEVYLNGDRVEAKFNGGGIDKFSEFVRGQFNYSKVKKSGRMIASFTIDVDGSLKNIKLVEMIDVDSGVELIRVLNKCPKWEPAKRGGKPISIEIKYPMVFNSKLPENQTKDDRKTDVASKDNSHTETAANNESGEVFNLEKIEFKPRYAGGITTFYKFIAENFRVPEEEGLSGKIMVSFIVETDGSLSNIKVLKDIGYGSGAEAIRVLKKSPKWMPGKQNGKPVRVEYTMPISISSSKQE